MSNNFLVDFTFGGLSAAVSKTITHPLERFKLLLGTGYFSTHRLRSEQSVSSHLWNCLVSVAKQEGIPFLWRGNMVNILRYAPTHAFNFSFKEKYKDFLKLNQKDVSFLSQLGRNLLAGGFAGASSLLIIYPFDFTRTTLISDYPKQFNGFGHCFTSILKSEGPLGLYKFFGRSALSVTY